MVQNYPIFQRNSQIVVFSRRFSTIQAEFQNKEKQTNLEQISLLEHRQVVRLCYVCVPVEESLVKIQE